MKKIIIFSIILYSLYGNSQNNIEARYDVSYNTARPTIKKAILKADDENIVYKEGRITDEKLLSEPSNGEISIQLKGSKTFNHTNFKLDSIFSKVDIAGHEYFLKEKKPSLSWKLLNDTKVSGSYTLKKATVNFRGRDYIAWYSEEVAFNAGPWKFSGLPGLIFEVKDTSNKYHWQLTKLSTLKSTISLPDCKNCETIDLKTFCFFKYEKEINTERFLKNLKRGESVTITRPARNGKETRFDWEN